MRTTRKAALSPREADCVRLLAEGNTAAEAGPLLGISSRTVEIYLHQARRFLGAKTNAQAVAIVLRREFEGKPTNEPVSIAAPVVEDSRHKLPEACPRCGVTLTDGAVRRGRFSYRQDIGVFFRNRPLDLTEQQSLLFGTVMLGNGHVMRYSTIAEALGGEWGEPARHIAVVLSKTRAYLKDEGIRDPFEVVHGIGLRWRGKAKRTEGPRGAERLRTYRSSARADRECCVVEGCERVKSCYPRQYRAGPYVCLEHFNAVQPSRASPLRCVLNYVLLLHRERDGRKVGEPLEPELDRRYCIAWAEVVALAKALPGPVGADLG